tara:strand:+ start:6509 stop:7141 length:633 start_codon:yes stop_codon:yes gene_type:complete
MYLISSKWSIETPYYFYKTTNLLNGKFYYGSGTKENYLGSGIAINRAIKKYGKENFHIGKLRFFRTRQEAYDFEDRFLKLFDIKSINESYNMKNNGKGYGSYTHTKESKQKMSAIAKVNSIGKGNSMYGKKHKQSSKELMSKKKKDIYNGENNPNFGKRGNESLIAKIYSIEGIEIVSAIEVAKKYKISKATVFRRLLSNKFPNWTRLNK